MARTSKAQRVERLTRLRDVILPRIPSHRIRQRYWECGTRRCLGGWSAMDRTFQKQGLSMRQDETIVRMPHFGRQWGLHALQSFFGLRWWEAGGLFGFTSSGRKKDIRRTLNGLIDGG